MNERLYPKRVGFEMLGLSNSNGHLEIKKGRLEAVKNGRRTFIKASEISRYIESLPKLASTSNPVKQDRAEARAA